MERRREVRVASDQTVRVTVLGSYRQRMNGKAVDLSGRGLRVVLPHRVSPGNPVKIELDDALLLGEICYCQPRGHGYITGIAVDQALNGLAELARLNDALFDDASEPRYPTPK